VFSNFVFSNSHFEHSALRMLAFGKHSQRIFSPFARPKVAQTGNRFQTENCWKTIEQQAGFAIML
jgi:hypothetical protein